MREAIVSRAAWGAGECVPAEPWPPAFHAIRKVIVHHTATASDDPDPATTVRAIHRYHALTRGWGDLGYNFLVDAAGRVYEGRAGEADPGQDRLGRGVTGAHVCGRNAGTVGIALLGAFDSRGPSGAALVAAEELIAWILAPRGIDPLGADEYVNPVSGERALFPNVAGHRDLAETACPGDALHATLADLRRACARRVRAAGMARPT